MIRTVRNGERTLAPPHTGTRKARLFGGLGQGINGQGEKLAFAQIIFLAVAHQPLVQLRLNLASPLLISFFVVARLDLG